MFALVVCDICCFSMICFSLGSIDFQMFSTGFLWIPRSLRIFKKTYSFHEIKGGLLEKQSKNISTESSILERKSYIKGQHIVFFIFDGFPGCHCCFFKAVFALVVCDICSFDVFFIRSY